MINTSVFPKFQAPPIATLLFDLDGMPGGIAAGMRVFSLHPREGLPDDVAQQVVFIDGLSDLQRWL